MYILENLFGLVFTAFEIGAVLCCPDRDTAFAASLCVLTTGDTVAVAFGFVGGFLFAVLDLLGDPSDSEEYATVLDCFVDLSLFLFSKDTKGADVSVLDLTCRVFENCVFLLVFSISDAFWLLAELLEFSESDELDSLPELDELLDEEPELVDDVDSELVVYKMILYRTVIINNIVLI